MTALIAALQFLTLFPLGNPRHTEPEKLIFAFPWVGLIIGGVVALCDLIFLHLGTPQVAASLDVALLALITGALHLDGLADTADGLLGHRKREAALAIMKDSRVGAMGLVVVVCVLLIKGAGLASLETHRVLCLILVPAYARAALLPAVYFLPYSRRDGGTGAFLFERPLRGRILLGALAPAAFSILLGRRALILNGSFLLLAFGLILFYRKRMGGITGDMMGAAVEVMESFLFCVLSLGGAA